MTILITGGGGFIGSHLTRRFLDEGHPVHVLDDFHQYVFPVRPSFLANMRHRHEVLLDGATIHRASIVNKDRLRRVVDEVRPTHVVHLAALPLANVAITETEEAFGTLLLGTENVLEVLRDHGRCQRLVFVSSSMVYGDFTQIPMPEDGAKDPKEIYGAMKLAGETLVKAFSRRFGPPFTICRPSAVYGPTDNNRRVVQVFVEQAMAGEAIVIDDPSTTLDFTYVEDTAQAIALATFSPRAENEVFNVTCGQGRTLADLGRVLGSHFEDLKVIEAGDAESFRPRRGQLDTGRARELLGYTPAFPLEEGVAAYLRFVREASVSP
jgi:UDP-glucose 4-epimerase